MWVITCCRTVVTADWFVWLGPEVIKRHSGAFAEFRLVACALQALQELR